MVARTLPSDFFQNSKGVENTTVLFSTLFIAQLPLFPRSPIIDSICLRENKKRLLGEARLCLLLTFLNKSPFFVELPKQHIQRTKAILDHCVIIARLPTSCRMGGACQEVAIILNQAFDPSGELQLCNYSIVNAYFSSAQSKSEVSHIISLIDC